MPPTPLSTPAAADGPVLDAALRDALAAVVGRDSVITDPARLVVYESDALTRYRSTPMAVVLPGSTGEVAEVVRLLAQRGVPMVARGAGTGLSGGAVASPDAVVVGLARLNRILRLDGRRRIARVEAGVVNAELSARARPLGLFYAPDPSSQTACTLGGNIAENSGGPHCLKYGVTTRYVTGLTMVTASGEVVELGGADRSDPIDLVGLVVGSEGCFGIVTEIEVRLLPIPESVRTLLGVFDTASAAGSAVSAIVARGLLPAALEIIDRATIEAVEASAFAAGYPTGAGAALVVEFDGVEAGLDDDAARAAEICREFGAIEVRRASTEEERLALWRGRKKAFGAMGRIAPDLMVQDATVPRSVLPAVLDRIAEIGDRYGLRVANVFHAGDGNLHPNILFDRRDAEESDRVERASKEIMTACVELGGTITGEHGVGLDKRAWMSLVHGPAELDAMRRVREVFDPAGVLNPGKVLPDREDDAAAPNGVRSGSGGEPHGTPAEAGSAEESEPDRVGEGGPHGKPHGIVEYRPEDLTITVRGDLPWEELERVTAARGQWVPFVTGTLPGRRVGEVVEAGGGGPLETRYGGLRDLVLGATLKGAHGPIRLGGRVVKNVAGFDLLRPVIGGGGVGGRVVEATLRLYPIPARMVHLRVALDRGPEITDLGRRLTGLDFVPAAALRVEDSAGAHLHLSLHGAEAEVAACEAEIHRRLQGVGEFVRSEGPEAARALRDALASPGSEEDGVEGHGSEGAGAVRAGRVAPGWIANPELGIALATLLREEATGWRVVSDLLTGCDDFGMRGLRAESARWTGLARRYRDAGGELRLTGGPEELAASLDAIRWEAAGRAGIPTLARRVTTAYLPVGGRESDSLAGASPDSHSSAPGGRP